LSIARLAAAIAASLLSDIPDFAVRYTRLCPGLGLDRPFPKTALDTLDYPVFDAAIFHDQPTSEARVVNFAQMGPPRLAAFRLDV
jgi:hypothetical protein